MPFRPLIAVLVLSVAASVAAQSHGPTGQSSPAVTCNGDGSFVAVWQGWGQDGNDQGVLGQRFDSAGAKLGEEFLVNSYTVDRQAHAAVCSAASGAFVVAWHSYGQDGDGYGVFAQRFDSSGEPSGAELQVNTTTAYSQGFPAIACDPAGDFVVVWSSGNQDGEDYGTFGRRFDSEGVPLSDEFQVNTYTSSSQITPAVAAGGSGSFVVVWASYEDQDGDGYGVFGQRFDSDGTATGSEFQVNTYTLNSQLAPSVAAGADGNFVVVWSSGQDGDEGYGVFAQRYETSGAAAGPEHHVNTFTAGDQGVSLGSGRVLAAAGGAGGEFVAVWQSSSHTGPAPDGDGIGVFAQRLAGSPLQPIGTEFQVNTFTTGDQAYPSLCQAPGGGFVVAWESRGGAGNGIFARIYNSEGVAAGGDHLVSSGTVQPPPPCPGDCDRDDAVTVDELLVGIGIALDEVSLLECAAIDRNEDGHAGIEELAAAVNAAVKGCPTRTPRPTETPVIVDERTRQPANTPLPTRTAEIPDERARLAGAREG
jgi:hypothetical protein